MIIELTFEKNLMARRNWNYIYVYVHVQMCISTSICIYFLKMHQILAFIYIYFVYL